VVALVRINAFRASFAMAIQIAPAVFVLKVFVHNRRVVMASKTEKKPTWTAVAIYVLNVLLERIVCRMMTAYRKFVILMGFASRRLAVMEFRMEMRQI
jgi:hypothetical protein